jgi:hypothetical protein
MCVTYGHLADILLKLASSPQLVQSLYQRIGKDVSRLHGLSGSSEELLCTTPSVFWHLRLVMGESTSDNLSGISVPTEEQTTHEQKGPASSIKSFGGA